MIDTPPTMPNVEDLVSQLATHLMTRGAMLATAESCTGGLLAATLTDLAGSSAWFERGWVTYSNAAKTQELSVAVDQIDRHGAVSEVVAAAMASGARQHANAQFAIAVTGIAGPQGGSADKPVGTVCFGWATPSGTDTETCCFSGDRRQVREQSVQHALAGLLLRLQEASGHP